MNAKPARPPRPEDDYAWLREGSMPQSREDRIAEILALVALLFSMGIGLLIALLPVPAQAAGTRAGDAFAVRAAPRGHAPEGRSRRSLDAAAGVVSRATLK